MVEYGDPKLPARFWDKVYPEPNTGCWLWGGAELANGYGRLTYQGRKQYAHHLTTGDIPAGMNRDHLCRVRECCNPDHIEVVTRKINILRGVGFSASHAAKTHCPNNHPYDYENTRITTTGSRVCRACHRAESRERYQPKSRP